jgi:hypothetical protein
MKKIVTMRRWDKRINWGECVVSDSVLEFKKVPMAFFCIKSIKILASISSGWRILKKVCDLECAAGSV